jgi:hypothetical protein
MNKSCKIALCEKLQGTFYMSRAMDLTATKKPVIFLPSETRDGF